MRQTLKATNWFWGVTIALAAVAAGASAQVPAPFPDPAPVEETAPAEEAAPDPSEDAVPVEDAAPAEDAAPPEDLPAAPAETPDIDALFAAIADSINSKQWDDAIAKLNDAQQIQPENATILLSRASVWQKKGELDKALADLDAASAIDPTLLAAIVARAAIYCEKGDDARTEEELAKAFAIDPNYFLALCLRGDISLNKADYRAAINDYSQAITSTPQDNREFLSNIYTSRACANFRSGDLAAAMNDCNVATSFNSLNDHAWITEAAVCRAKQDFAGAIAACLVAIKCDPSQPSYYSSFAAIRACCPDAQYRRGNEALEYATKACELTEYKDANALDALAAAYAEAGDFENATTWQYGAIAIADPSNKADMLTRARLYEQRRPFRF